MGSYMSAVPPKTPWPVLQAEIIRLGEDYEVELGDPESNTLYSQRCLKNPGHLRMTPVNEFSTSHLPQEWQDPAVVDAILYAARATVKIKVSFVSTDRPDDYAHSRFRGTSVTSSGSGMCVVDVNLKASHIECPLVDCSIQRPHRTTPVFQVKTAKHVVFDDLEARSASLEFFYDSSDRSTVVTGQVVGVDYSSVIGDETTLLCVSHDLSLLEKLKKTLPLTPSTGRSPSQPRAPLVVVISHPHGCEKQVSVGKWIGFENDQTFAQAHSIKIKDKLSELKIVCPSLSSTGFHLPGLFVSPDFVHSLERLVDQDPDATIEDARESDGGPSRRVNLASITYNAATCPGSSGARVLVLTNLRDHNLKIIATASHFRHRKGRGNASGRVVFDEKYQETVKALLVSMFEEKPYRNFYRPNIRV